MSGDNIMGGVNISPNIQKTKAQIDPDGNEVVPFTKNIIKPAEKPYIPTPEEIARTTQAMEEHTKEDNLTEPLKDKSITEQIEEAEKHLADLKLKKQAEIQRMKEELARLEQE